MEPAGFSSEGEGEGEGEGKGEGLHTLEFVNSFGLWYRRGECAESFF